ncbi:MAG: hypothetical protein GOP50_07785, partial [Candidatus Heimdallarchaeota archaeon]|nr:hypothetical protein [Candidatus Heimdallarchaeota archaeon]
MNNLILMLLIQCGLLLLMSLAGFILMMFFNESALRMKVFSLLTSLLLFGFAIANFSVFIGGYFLSSIIQIRDAVPLFSFFTYSFEFGLQLTLSQSIIYLTAMFVLAISNSYLSWKKPYWKEKHTSKLAFYGFSIILLTLAPNLFQILLFVLISDLILLDLVKSLVLKSKKKIPDAMKKMISSFILGDALLITASVLLAKSAKSLDFQIIVNDILTNTSTYNPTVPLLASLILLGIIFKNSLFPFHTWFKEISSSNEDSIFIFLSSHFMITLSILFITPFAQLILIQGCTLFVWYGLILALIGVAFSLFLKRELEISILIYTILSGMILFVLGLAELSIAFQILILLPVLSIGLVPYLFDVNLVDEEEIQKTKEFNIGVTITRFTGFVVLTSVILGVVPLNSSFLILIQTLYHDSSMFNIGFFILSLLLFYGIFSLMILIYKKQLKSALKFQFSKIEIIYTALIVIFLSLNSTLYPKYNLMNPFDFHPLLDPNVLWIPLVAVFAGCFIVLSAFIIIEKYFSDVGLKFSQISIKIENLLRTVYTFDFIFAPIGILWIKAIIPISIWFKQVIIQKFLVEIIILKTWRFITFIGKWSGRTIKDTIVPQIVQSFKSISEFIRELEIAKLRTQIQLVLVSLSLLLMIILILYSGGKI